MSGEAEAEVTRKRAIRPYWLTSKAWLVQANFLAWSHLLLGIAATLVTSLIAVQPPLLGAHPEALIANLKWLAVALTSLLTFLNPREMAQRYQQAQRHLHDAVVQFQVDPTYDLKEVIAARQRAGALLHQRGQMTSSTEGPTPLTQH